MGHTEKRQPPNLIYNADKGSAAIKTNLSTFKMFLYSNEVSGVNLPVMKRLYELVVVDTVSTLS